MDCASTALLAVTMPPYNGTTGLAVSDAFCTPILPNTDGTRALSLYSTGPKVPAIYNRPRALLVHAPPIDYPRLGFNWIDPHPYQVLAYVYRPRFRRDGYLFVEYAHLDHRNFTRRAADDPMECIFANNHGLRKHSTIGKLQGQPEERSAWLLTSFHLVGFYVEFVRIMLSVLLRRLRGEHCH